MVHGRENDTLQDKFAYIIAAFVCGAVGGNMLIYSVGQIFVKSNFFEEYLFGPLLTWTGFGIGIIFGFGIGIIFFVFAIFFVRECFRECPR